MQIQWLGLASFKIQTSHSVIITDPFADDVGITFPKLKAEIVLVSDTQSSLANNTKRLSGEPFIITGPGEYEIQNTFIYGVPAEHTVFLLEDERIKVAFLGCGELTLGGTQLEALEGADILLLPINSLTKEQRTTLISQLEPRVIIPYLYQQPGVKQITEPLETFLKEMGLKSAEPKDKYTIKYKDLPQEDTATVILEPNY